MKQKQKWQVAGYSLFVLSSFLFFYVSSASAQTLTGKPVGLIKTAGARTLTSEQLLSRIRTRLGEPFDPAKATADSKRIAELAGVESSYYNAVEDAGAVVLTFVIIEKNLVRVIELDGNKRLKDGRLKDKLDFKLGDYLDPALAEAGRVSILEFYYKQGHPFATVKLDRSGLGVGKVTYEIEEGPRVKIKSLEFKGNDSIKSNELQKVVKTKPKTLGIFQKYYSAKKATEDVVRLSEAYYRRGYLDVSVTEVPVFSQDRKSVKVIFRIKEGQVYTINDIKISGNMHFEKQYLLGQIRSEVGKIYNKIKAQSDLQKLLKVHREIGFINAKVEQNVKFVGANKVNLEYTIDEGERFRIGTISILGNEKTQDKVVRRVLDEYDFTPGNWYNADYARGNGQGFLEKRVRQSAYMKSATVTPFGEQPGQRDAVANLIEGQTGSVMFGAGVSTDSGAIGQIIYQERNFDIGAWPDSFGDFVSGEAFRGAGQIFKLALEPGTEYSTYSINFTDPYWRDKPISMNVRGVDYERDRESYDEERLRALLGFERRYKNKWRRSINFRVENVHIDPNVLEAPTEVYDDKGDNLLIGTELGFTRNLTDDPYYPTSGKIYNVSYEQVAGDHTFGVLSGTYRTYSTVHEDLAQNKTVLASKIHAATIFGDAPVFEKFYAGGQGSLRGFDYRGVSPRGINPLTGEEDDPIGSDWIFLANSELIVPLASDKLAMLFFVDSGTVESGSYRAAVGCGFQIMIPQWFGQVPMRFEFAVPVLDDDLDDTQVFSFSAGGLF